MGKLLLAILVVQFLIFGSYANSAADELSLRCTVNNVYDLSDDGQLVKSITSPLIGVTFSIDRTTGRIVGNVFNNEGDFIAKVIDGGSFKVFSFAEQRGVAESLAIRTWQDGEEKPFIGIDYLQKIFVGTCN